MNRIPYFILDLAGKSKVNVFYNTNEKCMMYDGVIVDEDNEVTPILGKIPSDVETEVYDDDDLELTAESVYNHLTVKYGKLPNYKLEDLTSKKQGPSMNLNESKSDSIMEFNQWKGQYAIFENSLKDLVGKSDEDELDVDDAASIGKKISKMKGEDRKKYIGIVNFMGASCRIYNEIWANYKPVDPSKKKSNRGKLFKGEKPDTA